MCEVADIVTYEWPQDNYSNPRYTHARRGLIMELGPLHLNQLMRISTRLEELSSAMAVLGHFKVT